MVICLIDHSPSFSHITNKLPFGSFFGKDIPLQVDAFRGHRLSLLGKGALRGLRLMLFPLESPPFTPFSTLTKGNLYKINSLFKSVKVSAFLPPSSCSLRLEKVSHNSSFYTSYIVFEWLLCIDEIGYLS